MILNREPVMFLALIQTGLALLLAFGLHLSGVQIGATMAFAAAILGFIARTQVTPLAAPKLPLVLLFVFTLFVLPWTSTPASATHTRVVVRNGVQVVVPDSSLWAPWRLAGGVAPQYVMYDSAGSRRADGFLPDVWLSYSLASTISLAGNLERDFGIRGGDGTLGARVTFLTIRSGAPFDLAFGVDRVWYDRGMQRALGLAFDKSIQFSLRGAAPLVRWKSWAGAVYAAGQVRWDQRNNRVFPVASLKLQAFGGKP